MEKLTTRLPVFLVNATAFVFPFLSTSKPPGGASEDADDESLPFEAYAVALPELVPPLLAEALPLLELRLDLLFLHFFQLFIIFLLL